MSNKTMTDPNSSLATQTSDQRLTELEIKATYTEDLLDALEKIVVRQQQQLDLLMREAADLRQPSIDGEVRTARSLRDDLPPHF